MCGGVVGDIIDVGEDIVNTIAPISLDIVTFGNGDAAWYSLSGNKDRDERKLKDKQDELEDISSDISSIQEKLDNKAFLEQIFKYGDIRRIRDLGTQYEQLAEEYSELLNDYKKNQDGNFFISITNFIPNVISAFAYNILDFIKTGDYASLRTAITIGFLIAAIVVSILALPASGGSTSQTIALSLAILSSILTLDAMVNNSGLLGVAFKIFDLILNKILHLDKYLNTEGFNEDSKYYEAMMNDARMVVAISSLAAGLYAIYTTPASASSTASSRMAARNLDFTTYATNGTYAGQSTILSTSSGIAGASSKYSSFMDSIGSYSVSGVSLSDMYEAYSNASKINDVYGAMTLHKELQDKLGDAKDEIQKNINKTNRQKFEASYSDAEYIMNQVDMSYHSYVLAMSEAGQTDVFDPEGTVVMNTRYSPKRAVMFGYEDMFNYESMAGGELYTYNTLWK